MPPARESMKHQRDQQPAARRRSVSEFTLINWLVSWLSRNRAGSAVVLGPQDDCAVVRIGGTDVLLTTDSLVEGVHFKRHWLSAVELGRRAFLVAASDLAAMGGVPRAALLSLEVPANTPAAYLQSIIKGFAVACRRHGTDLVGGNICRAPGIGVTPFLIGQVCRAAVERTGARPGDRIFVSGTIGDAAGGLALLRSPARRKRCAKSSVNHLVKRWVRPPSRFNLARLVAGNKLARAMVDLSDGLLQDLGHVCRLSGVAAVLTKEKLPISKALQREFGKRAASLALTGGEDYELLMAVPKGLEREMRRLAPRVGCRLTEIGEFSLGNGVGLVDSKGRMRRVRGPLGFDHLLKER